MHFCAAAFLIPRCENGEKELITSCSAEPSSVELSTKRICEVSQFPEPACTFTIKNLMQTGCLNVVYSRREIGTLVHKIISNKWFG